MKQSQVITLFSMIKISWYPHDEDDDWDDDESDPMDLDGLGEEGI